MKFYDVSFHAVELLSLAMEDKAEEVLLRRIFLKNTMNN